MTNGLPLARPLRIGVLGAARIVPNALLKPVRSRSGVIVAAVAARDAARAREFAARHAIPQVHADYAALIADPSLDAIYNPLPNHAHYEWTVRALAAGKHVLCEKPLAANATEALAMCDAAQDAGCVLMEAFHYRYHPLITRALAIIQSGELGTIRHIRTAMCIPGWRWWDIRYRYELAGGALMDVGCYTIHLLRTLAGTEPQITHATARLRSPQVDRALHAQYTFGDGRTGEIICSMWSRRLLDLHAEVIGTQGTLHLTNPYLPHHFHRLTVETPAGRRQEQIPGESTYTHQLDAFLAAIATGTPPITDANDGIANMQVIDATYRAAGLVPRGT